MRAHVLGIVHLRAGHVVQGEVGQLVNGRSAVGIELVGRHGVAGIGVELIAPGRLHFGGAEPFGKGRHSGGLLGRAAGLVQNAQILGDVVGAVGDVHQRPVLRLKGALQGMVGAVRRVVDLAVERRGVEGADLHVALVQGIEAVGIAGEVAVGAVVPQGLPAVHGDAAGGRLGIGEGVEHGGVDVGVGGAADLALAVPGVVGIDDVSPVIKVQLFAVGAELVVTVEHQDVLDDKAIGLAVILVLANLVGPGGSPVDDGQVLIGAVNQLAPAGLVQAEDQVAVLVLIGGLDSGGITRDDGVIVNADGEACGLGLVNEPGGTFSRVGVRIDADGVTGIIIGKRHGAGQGENHGQRKKQG